MYGSSEKPSPEDEYPDIFNEAFFPQSFYRDEEHRLGSIDLSVAIGSETFLLTVESFPVHVARRVADYKDNDESDDPSVYVLSREEILPSDLVEIQAILQLNPELLEQYLVKQAIEPDSLE